MKNWLMRNKRFVSNFYQNFLEKRKAYQNPSGKKELKATAY